MASEFDKLLNTTVYLLLVAPVKLRKRGAVRRLVGGWVGKCAWPNLLGAVDGVWSAVSESGRVGTGSVLLIVEEHVMAATTRQKVEEQLSILWTAGRAGTRTPWPASAVTSSTRPKAGRSRPWKNKWSKLNKSPIKSVSLTFTSLGRFADSVVFQLPDPDALFFGVLRSAHLGAVNGANRAAYDLSAHGVAPEAGEILDAYAGPQRWDQVRRGGTCAERLKRYLLPILPRSETAYDGPGDLNVVDAPDTKAGGSSVETELDQRLSETDRQVFHALEELGALGMASACSGHDLAAKLKEEYATVTQRVKSIRKRVKEAIGSGTNGRGYCITQKGRDWLKRWPRGQVTSIAAESPGVTPHAADKQKRGA